MTEEAGFHHLVSCEDPVMAALAGSMGPLCREARRRGRPKDAYGSLVRAVVGQQISAKAARTVYRRLMDLFGGNVPGASEVLTAREEDLRDAGLSARKVEYLRNLALRVQSGELNLDGLHHLPDEAVVEQLSEVRGIGRWSAEMFLIFYLNRPDVLPVGDLGIRRAAEQAYGLTIPPGPGELRKLAEPWRPHRTLACLYLWESLTSDR